MTDRLRWGKRVLAAIFSAQALLGCSTASAPASERCELAWAALKPNVWADEGHGFVLNRKLPDALGMMSLDEAADPDISRLFALALKNPQSVSEACPEIRRQLRSVGGSVGRARKRLQPDSLYLDVEMSMTAPVLFSQGTEAVIVMEGDYGRLAGGGALEHWRRDPSGEWRKVNSYRIWVS